MRPLLPTVIAALLLSLALGPASALAHGGDEEAMEVLKMQPARTLAQQALVELKVNGDSEDAATRLDAALESEDTSGIDMAVLRRAMETLDAGNPQEAIPLLDEALSRPNGAKHGAALHEAGQEFEPATGAQEIFAIVAGVCLVLLGLLALGPRCREGSATPSSGPAR